VKAVEGHAGSSNGRRIVSALVLTAIVAVVSVSLTTAVAQANHGRHYVPTVDVTFTKWATTPPAEATTSAGVLMAGVVGGAAGRGVSAGRIIDDDTAQAGFWLGHARYEFHGRKHFFAADIHIVEDDTVVPNTAALVGVVTGGWLKGAGVTGDYTTLDPCPVPTPGNVHGATCFSGTLHLQLAQRHRRH
jgi:hypothetical protein